MRILVLSLIFSVVLIFLIDRDADVFAQRVTLFDIPSMANTPLSLFSNQTSNITTLDPGTGTIVINPSLNPLGQAAVAHETANRNLTNQLGLESAS